MKWSRVPVGGELRCKVVPVGGELRCEVVRGSQWVGS